MERDFTYIADIVEGVVRLIDIPAKPDSEWDGNNPDPSSSLAPYRLYNIGNNSPVLLEDFISIIESATGLKAKKEYLPIQPGDVEATFADIDALYDAIKYKPKTSIKEGIGYFIDWYREYYFKDL